MDSLPGGNAREGARFSLVRVRAFSSLAGFRVAGVVPYMNWLWSRRSTYVVAASKSFNGETFPHSSLKRPSAMRYMLPTLRDHPIHTIWEKPIICAGATEINDVQDLCGGPAEGQGVTIHREQIDRAV
jgi:hypothetical protein